MSKEDLFATAEGDKLTDLFNDECREIAKASGVKLASTLMLAATDMGVSIAVMGCRCLACRTRMVEAVAQTLGFKVTALAAPAVADAQIH